MKLELLEELRSLLRHKKSKKFYAERLGISEVEVGKLIAELREQAEEEYHEDDEEDDSTRLVSEKVNEDGSRDLQYSSPKPLSREEIEELYGIDNINTTLSTYWNKQTASGRYLVSALVKCRVTDFYTLDQLEQKLGEIFPAVREIKLKEVKGDSNNVLIVYISDDHCGNAIKNSIYNKEYTGTIYQDRLLEIVAEVKKFTHIFDKIYVINLGDEADGWNGKTTRYDHDLDGSLSNKEQFDIYTTGRKAFYDALFTSGVAKEYEIISLNNSNHTGLGLSYILNKSLEFYLESRYPNVTYTNYDKFIDFIQIGNHIIGLTHGKDEALMKSPLPLNLDAKTDLWLFEFYDKLGFSPNDNFISTVKGDIHKYNVNCGKSGRYVNVPSIAGGSGWIELNFGDSRAGALIEIVNPDTPNIISIPIWFN